MSFNKYSFRLSNLIKNGIVVDVREIGNKSVYKTGYCYWCGYFQKYYKVLSYELKDYNGYKRLKNVTIKWEDGRVFTHCTHLDPDHDYKIILNKKYYNRL